MFLPASPARPCLEVRLGIAPWRLLTRSHLTWTLHSPWNGANFGQNAAQSSCVQTLHEIPCFGSIPVPLHPASVVSLRPTVLQGIIPGECRLPGGLSLLGRRIPSHSVPKIALHAGKAMTIRWTAAERTVWYMQRAAHSLLVSWPGQQAPLLVALHGGLPWYV